MEGSTPSTRVWNVITVGFMPFPAVVYLCTQEKQLDSITIIPLVMVWSPIAGGCVINPFKRIFPIRCKTLTWDFMFYTFCIWKAPYTYTDYPFSQGPKFRCYYTGCFFMTSTVWNAIKWQVFVQYLQFAPGLFLRLCGFRIILFHIPYSCICFILHQYGIEAKRAFDK